MFTADHETGGLQKGTSSYYFTSNNHTAADVYVFATGVGASNFTGTMVNTDISAKIKQLMESVDTSDSDTGTTTDTETTAPDTETTAPDTETTVPITETTGPDTETTVPDTETTVPVTETTVPVTETTAPNTQTTTTSSTTTTVSAVTTQSTKTTTNANKNINENAKTGDTNLILVSMFTLSMSVVVMIIIKKYKKV